MDFLKSLLLSLINNLLHRHRKRPDALEFSILAKLPLELLVLIAEFLPLASAVTFSLSCRPLYSLIGTKYLKRAKQDTKSFDPYALLALLQRDLPDLLACHYCKKLHAIKHASRFLDSSKYYKGWIRRPKPICVHANYRRTLYIHPDFSSTIFRMAMKRHRQGADCSSLLNLLSCEWRIFYHAKHIGKVNTECRIVQNSLLVRNQSVFPVQPRQSVEFLFESGFLICSHYNWRRYGPCAPTSQLELRHREKSFKAWGQLMQCNYCATEFRIDVQRFKNLGRLVFFTKWQNLGSGERLLDTQWRSHLSTSQGPMWRNVFLRSGSIVSAFENKQKFDFGSLMAPEDKMELFSLPLQSP